MTSAKRQLRYPEMATLPADGMSAAEKRSFGTLRWRLLNKTYFVAEGAATHGGSL